MSRLKPKTALRLEEPLRAVIDAIPAHVFSIWPDGEVDFLNRLVLDYFGLRAEDMQRWNWQGSIHPEDLAQFVSDRHAALASGRALDREMRIRRADGQYRWWLVRHAPQRNKSGEIMRWFGVAVDIEDRKLAEEAALEQRLLERTRIARELHDTLLQSVQALLMKLHIVTHQLSDRPEVHRTLETVVEQVRQAVTEGRDAVLGLRSSTVVTNDLARAIRVLGAELADQGESNSPEFAVRVEGTSREVAPIVRDDIFRIAREALRNAFQHAQPTRIEVEIRYEPRQLCLHIRDDGKGIDPKVLEAGARAGHYGLPGLQERAKLAGGKLTVRSERGSGTEVELTVPASAVYTSASARVAKFLRKSAS